MTQPIRPSQRDFKVQRRLRSTGTLPTLYTAGRSMRVGAVPETESREDGFAAGTIACRVRAGESSDSSRRAPLAAGGGGGGGGAAVLAPASG